MNATKTVDQAPIAVGEVITLDNVSITGADLAYDAGTGLFTILTTGTYVIHWLFSATPEPGTTALEIDLNLFPGAVFVDGISVASVIDMLVGTNYVFASIAGDTFGFINGSDGPIDIVTNAAPGPIGTVSVFRIA